MGGLWESGRKTEGVLNFASPIAPINGGGAELRQIQLHLSTAARIRSIVSSIRSFLDTSSPRSSAILQILAGSRGIPPASMAEMSCLARRISDGMPGGLIQFKTREMRAFHWRPVQTDKGALWEVGYQRLQRFLYRVARHVFSEVAEFRSYLITVQSKK